ncbi:hypothetical protein AAVH_00616 [Aphelenchoides avenae]|nr:hypothetical protein AAVH_00616 [Aphelenchus avenae]
MKLKQFDKLEPRSAKPSSSGSFRPKARVSGPRNYVSEQPPTAVSNDVLSNKKFDPEVYIPADVIIKEVTSMRDSSLPPHGQRPSKNQKTLQEKSVSSSALRTGPYAAIRENELKKKQKTSLDESASMLPAIPLIVVLVITTAGEEIPVNGNGPSWPQSFGQQVQSHVQSAGENIDRAGQSLANVGDKLTNGASNAVNQVANAVREAGELALGKLKEAKNEIAEKFRPMVDNAIEIFQQPGDMKQRWDKLVEKVENTNLTVPEKQELYQKIANATSEQQIR